jgi:hypothetical protein
MVGNPCSRNGTLVAAHHLAVDQDRPHLEVVHGLHHQREARRPIVAPAGDQPDADRVSPRHEPVPSCLISIGGGWEAGLDKAGGHCPVYLGGRGGESRSPHRCRSGVPASGGPLALNLVRDASDTREGVSRTIHRGTLGVPGGVLPHCWGPLSIN